MRRLLFQIFFVPSLIDTDGSETLVVRIQAEEGTDFSTGTDQGNGLFQFTAAQISGAVTMTPPTNRAGDFTMTVIGEATEDDGDVEITEDTVTINLTQQPDAFNIQNLNDIIDITTTSALHDKLDNALIINDPTDLSILGTTADATQEGDEPSFSSVTNTVHFKFIPDEIMSVRTELIDLGPNHLLRIRQVTDKNEPITFDNLTILESAVTDRTRIYEAGEIYIFTIDGSSTQKGAFQLDLTQFEIIHNDNFADRVVLDSVHNIRIEGHTDSQAEAGTI